MSWVRLSDDFAEHPKVRQLDEYALAVHVWGLCHCARHLTDGFVANDALRACTYARTRVARGRALTHLVQAGVWEEAEGGYRIHDYLDYNPDAASVKEKRRRAAERQKRWRTSKRRSQRRVTDASTDARVTHIPSPAPKRAGEDGAPNGRAPSLLKVDEGCERCDHRPSFYVRDHVFCEEHLPRETLGGLT